MSSLLQAPLDELTAQDVDAFCDRGPTESETLELKESIPSQEKEVWAEEHNLHKGAKKSILKEVVALANSYGGALILGVGETKDDPPRADSPTPIPSCADLVTRLEDLFRDAIEPRIPGLQIRSIPYPEESSKEGIVIVRVQQSRLRPHRSQADREVYARISRSAAKLTMHQIQDRVIYARQSLERVEQRLDSRRLSNTERPQLGIGPATCMVRATAVPSSSDSIILPYPYQHGREFSHLTRHRRAVFDGEKNDLEMPFSWDSKAVFRPVLRGAVREYKKTIRERYDRVHIPIYREVVEEDGLVELTYQYRVHRRGGDEHLKTRSIAAIAACTLSMADQARKLADAPGAEYIVEVGCRLWPMPPASDDWKPTRFDIQESFQIPRIPFSGPGLNAPLKAIINDLRNLQGEEHIEDLQVDWTR